MNQCHLLLTETSVVSVEEDLRINSNSNRDVTETLLENEKLMKNGKKLMQKKDEERKQKTPEKAKVLFHKNQSMKPKSPIISQNLFLKSPNLSRKITPKRKMSKRTFFISEK